MKYVVIVAVLIIMVLFFRLIIFSIQSKNGTSLGLKNGQLAPCETKPNCVCSEYPENQQHFIQPIDLQTNNVETLKRVISEMGGTVIEAGDDYLAATFQSNVFKFIDDLELRLDKSSNLLHIRSASRVGYSDMGVNKKRVAKLKSILNPQ